MRIGPDKWIERPGDLTYEDMLRILRNYPVGGVGEKRDWISLGEIERDIGARVGSLKEFVAGNRHAFGKRIRHRLMNLLRRLDAGQVDRMKGELVIRPEREPAKVHVYTISLPVDRHGKLRPTMVRGKAQAANSMPNLFASFRGFALPEKK